jgi:hypothetical protein
MRRALDEGATGTRAIDDPATARAAANGCGALDEGATAGSAAAPACGRGRGIAGANALRCARDEDELGNLDADAEEDGRAGANDPRALGCDGATAVEPEATDACPDRAGMGAA